MIDIKKKSQLEITHFIKYYKFNIFIFVSVIFEFLQFIYKHIQHKYLLKINNNHQNFIKNKKLYLSYNPQFICFKPVTFKKINYKNTLKYTNKIKFNNLDKEKKSNEIRYYFLIDFIEKRSDPDLILQKFIRLYNVDKSKLIFKNDIYSASERLSNIILFLSYFKHTNYKSEEIKKILILHIKQISENIEYHNDLTNNHILNNFRSLILASVFISDQKLFKSSLLNLLNFYSLIFDKNGFIKEGSSHYQLLVHSWIEDIYFFCINNNFHKDKETLISINRLSKYVTSLRSSSSLFLILYKRDEINIGDISPDLHPKFIINKIKNLYNINLSKVSNKHLSSNWAIFNKKKLQFISGLSKSILTNKRSHCHNDMASFVLFYNTYPIVTDLGRYDYTKSNISQYHYSSFSHNSIFVDKLSLYPHFFYRNFIPKKLFNKIIKTNSIIRSHNGFKINSKGFNRYNLLSKFSRKFEIFDNYLKIEDQLTSFKTRKITLVYNLGKTLKLLSGENNKNMYSYNNKNKVIFDFSENSIPLNIVSKRTFLSQSYGNKIHVSKLIINFSLKGKMKFITKIKFI